MVKLPNDPLADLVPAQPPVTDEQLVQVAPAKEQAQSASQSGKFWTLLAFVLAIIVAFLVGARFYGQGGGDDRKQDDQHEQKQDDKKQDDKKADVLPKGSWIMFVEETGDRQKFPHLAAIQADKAWHDSMEAKGLIVGWYDIGASEIAKWKGDADKVGLPALLVLDPKGNVLKGKEVPPTSDAVNDFVFGGAK